MQLQTVSALYDQETVRNNGQPSYTRLKTSVRLHIDQMMRTRNFRAGNEIVERESVTKSQIWRKASVERKVGECYQWKAIGQYSKGDSCSSSQGRQSGKKHAIRDKKDNRPPESARHFSSKPDCNNTADVPSFIFCVPLFQKIHSSRIDKVSKFDDSMINLHRICQIPMTCQCFAISIFQEVSINTVLPGRHFCRPFRI